MWRNQLGETKASDFIAALSLLLTDIYQSKQSLDINHPFAVLFLVFPLIRFSSRNSVTFVTPSWFV